MNSTTAIRESAIAKPGSLGRLYDLLDEHLKDHRTRLNRLSIAAVASALDVSTQAVYRWFDMDKLPAQKVNPLIELSGKDEDGNPRLSLDLLAPFVLK